MSLTPPPSPYQSTRPAEFAGTLYPEDERLLLHFVERVLLDVSTDRERANKRKAQCVFLPHGPYVYAAECAAATLARVEIPDIVLILHPRTVGSKARARAGLGDSLMSLFGLWETPLGTVPVHQPLARHLVEHGAALPDDGVEDGEHSGEVILPMLQTLNQDLEVCILSIADGDAASARRIGKAVAAACSEVGEEKILIVALSDFQTGPTKAAVERADDVALEQIERLDAAGLLAALDRHGVRITGAAPLAVMIEAARAFGCSEIVVQSETTSADAGDDLSEITGYASGWIR